MSRNQFSLRMGSLCGRLIAASFVLILAYGCSSGGGTEGTWGRSISGVLTTEQGQPQIGARVELLETGTFSTTDEAGFFSLDRVELPDTPINLQISNTGLNAVVTLDQELPKQEISVAMSIKVETQMAARIDEVIIITATPTPRPPTAVPTQAATPTVPAPTATPVPGVPTPLPTATSTPQLTATPTPTSTPTPSPTPLQCPGDVDGNGVIDLSDLATVLAIVGATQGQPEYNPAADLNMNRIIDSGDVDLLLAVFGTTCP